MSEEGITFNRVRLLSMNEELVGLIGSCSRLTQVITLKIGFIASLLNHSSAILHLDTREKRKLLHLGKNYLKHGKSLKGRNFGKSY